MLVLFVGERIVPEHHLSLPHVCKQEAVPRSLPPGPRHGKTTPGRGLYSKIGARTHQSLPGSLVVLAGPLFTQRQRL